ncbi:MAG: hypothetical protein GF368_00895 [Candidatus Aenigmarchaeota archaeon]|nr:hypothetical protein [Candidatus Aenigmarchaeota archaeon]
MKKKYVIGILSLMTIGVLGLSFAMAMPFGLGGFSEDLTEEEFNTMRQEQQSLQEAVENGDYETWKILMENRIERMKTELTEENFQNMVERHNSMQEMRESREQMRIAWEEGDYETFQQLREQMSENAPGGEFEGMKPRGRGLF